MTTQTIELINDSELQAASGGGKHHVNIAPPQLIHGPIVIDSQTAPTNFSFSDDVNKTTLPDFLG